MVLNFDVHWSYLQILLSVSGVVNLLETTFKSITHAALYIMNEENVSDYMWSRRTKEIVNEIIFLFSLVQTRLAQSKVIPQMFLRIMQRIWENNIVNRSQCLESKEYQHKKQRQKQKPGKFSKPH